MFNIIMSRIFIENIIWDQDGNNKTCGPGREEVA